MTYYACTGTGTDPHDEVRWSWNADDPGRCWYCHNDGTPGTPGTFILSTATMDMVTALGIGVRV